MVITISVLETALLLQPCAHARALLFVREVEHDLVATVGVELESLPRVKGRTFNGQKVDASPQRQLVESDTWDAQ